MLISHRHRFIFIKTRKTAGTSVEVLLSRLCGDEDVVTWIYPPIEGHTPRNFQSFFNPLPGLAGRRREDPVVVVKNFLRRYRFYNHMSARTISNRVSRSVWTSYFKFCFERNPWDKVVSFYHWKTRDMAHPQSFSTFLEEGELPTDFDQYSLDGRPCVDFIGRYENLEEDFRTALARIGLSAEVELPRAKTGLRSNGRHYSSYYDDATRERIGRVFRREIDLLGYEFEQR